ncbi:MAG: carboxypeptidase-like regulatory domain-containing protein, partial [Saprospiraceae bacterium]|nr:carboxypeptidase-like regulatory domain-containing protein [Saprospiraceae bacterium]
MKRQYLTWLLALFTILSISNLSAQSITGKVSAQSDAQSLIGVSISVKGSTVGTITDVDGNYEIAAGPNDVLIFTYIGYTAIEESVNGRSVMDVSLAEDVKTLQEVIVTGYGTQIKRDLTGNIAKIKASEFKDIP